MARTSMAVQPDAGSTEERAALLAEIERLRAQVAAAPPPAPVKAPEPPPVPKADSDPYGKPFEMPRQMHGVWLRDPVTHQGKDYNPGSVYTKGPFGKPLTVGEVREIMSAASRACHLLATKDHDYGEVVSLGRFGADVEA